MTKHAFYSATGAQVAGTKMWRNEAGDLVELTFVDNRKKMRQNVYPDTEYRGPVTEYVRQGRPSPRSYQ